LREAREKILPFAGYGLSFPHRQEIIDPLRQGLRTSTMFRYNFCQSTSMPSGSKSKYSDKQKRQAEHIEESFEKQGVPKKTAAKRAWQTVNKQSGGGEKSGSGRDVGKAAKKSARKESGERAARSRKLGSRRVQKSPTRHRASQGG
jgi:plasmid stabilization system protein ParE